MSKHRYDWNRYGALRLALFNRAMSWFLICMAVLSCPFFIISIMRDWTVIFALLIFTAAPVVMRLALRKIYRAKPDYAAIARMEREIYGRTFG